MKIKLILSLIMLLPTIFLQGAEMPYQAKEKLDFHLITNNTDIPINIRIREDKDKGFIYYQEDLDPGMYDTFDLESIIYSTNIPEKVTFPNAPEIEKGAKLRYTITNLKTGKEILKRRIDAISNDITIMGQKGNYRIQAAQPKP